MVAFCFVSWGPTKSRPEPSGTIQNRLEPSGRHSEPSGHRPDAARSCPDAARVGQDSNPCMTVLIPLAAPGLSVVTVGWLLQLSFKKPPKMRSLMV